MKLILRTLQGVKIVKPFFSFLLHPMGALETKMTTSITRNEIAHLIGISCFETFVTIKAHLEDITRCKNCQAFFSFFVTPDGCPRNKDDNKHYKK
jgi:hypothetical protein